MEVYVTEAKLKEVAQVDDLGSVTYIEMKVDTREHSLSTLGGLLPALQQLKLNHSVLRSIRDLGTSLRSLRVLWVARCDLRDLEGISTLDTLSELYAAFNEITDVSPLAGMDALTVLDLEGNAITDVEALAFLQMTPSLAALTVESNPIAAAPGYRRAVVQHVPQLTLLDDEDVSELDRVPMSPEPLVLATAEEEEEEARDVAGPTQDEDERMVLHQKIKEAPRLQLSRSDGVLSFTATTCNSLHSRRPASAGPSTTVRRASHPARYALAKTCPPLHTPGDLALASPRRVTGPDGQEIDSSRRRIAPLPPAPLMARAGGSSGVRPTPPPRPHTAMATTRAPMHAWSDQSVSGQRRSRSRRSAQSSSSTGSTGDEYDAEEDLDNDDDRDVDIDVDEQDDLDLCSDISASSERDGRSSTSSSRTSSVSSEDRADVHLPATPWLHASAGARQLATRLGPLGMRVVQPHAPPRRSGKSDGMCRDTGLAPAPARRPISRGNSTSTRAL